MRPTLNNASRLSIHPQVWAKSRTRISANTKNCSKPSTPKSESASALHFTTRISGVLITGQSNPWENSFSLSSLKTWSLSNTIKKKENPVSTQFFVNTRLSKPKTLSSKKGGSCQQTEPMKGKIRTRPTKDSFLSPTLLNEIKHWILKWKEKKAKRARILTDGRSLTKGFKMIKFSNFFDRFKSNIKSIYFLSLKQAYKI